ncbi:metallophosphoesterase [Apibacter adventoris]|uniref:Phosphoesterase n=1 Tax=Apibacter adventoris TaxID=1679466 RepID=A0A2S8A6Y6_9FLAO|nr:metallophosphoesterase [Apibacter adventoris]PQL90337.1 phosphoesterase [Apibacter adventoris]
MKSLIGILFISSIFIEFYSYQAIKTLTDKKWIRKTWIIISLSALLLILIWSLNIDRNNRTQVQFLMAFFIIDYVPKLVLALVLFINDIIRFITFLFKKIFSSSKEKVYFPARRKAISTLGIGLASIPFLSIIEGIVWGKYDFTVRKVHLTFPNLPDKFDGYKIVQVSDMHLGSFDINAYDKVAKGIQLINDQNPDLFLFTGDSVNNLAKEMDPWLSLLQTIKAKDGKYSILGNHDYGIYMLKSRKAQKANTENIHARHQKIGWVLLNNEAVKIYKDDQYINIIGVENWGLGHFPKYADLSKATKDVKEGDFNILMSHDPTHFDVKVKEFPKKMHLTLAGHTHGMQFGVEIPGIIKWSPIKYRYPKWAGLYQDKGRFLYVNRGFGYIGFPGRVGIWPEITVIELKKG